MVIKPKQPVSSELTPVYNTKKVAAYCRVSTDSEEQLNSYKQQVSYYTALIQGTPEWEFVCIYADEGISGTSSERRPEFQRMIKDAKDGKIDLILTKSISRFARNTVDILRYTRELKEHGIGVKFEKENINTLEASGEIFLTIFSSLAQEESRSISENCKWGIVKGFKDGKVFCNTNRFLGYDKDDKGNLIINKEEAEVVKRIYKDYLGGKSYLTIAKELQRDEVKTGAGKTKWWDSTVNVILKNEKYCGDLLQQKTVTVDFLNHKRVKNTGEYDQYYIQDNHEAIIPRDMFEEVQREMARRSSKVNNNKGDRQKYSNKYPFSSKIICGNCGSVFKRRHWNSTNSSKKVVWQCKEYIKNGKDACNMKAVDETVLEQAFVEIFNEVKLNKEEILGTVADNIGKILKNQTEVKQIEAVDVEIEILKEQLKSLVQLKVQKQLDTEVYNEEYARVSNELSNLRQRRTDLEQNVERIESIKKRIESIKQVVSSKEELLEAFDADIFNALVDKIEIIDKTHFCFVLKNGVRVDRII